MKKLLCLVLLFPLSGCMWKNVSGLELSAVVYACKDKGGVRNVTAYIDGSVAGQCGDGSWVDTKAVAKLVFLSTPLLIQETK